MEINITRFFNEASPMDYSASVAEIGNNAGADTWRSACDDSQDYMMIDDDEKREAFRDYVKEFGAWTGEEIAAWSDIELNALFIQLVAGDMREAGIKPCSTDDDWREYRNDVEVGHFSGNIWRDDTGEVFYYIGN